MPALRTDEERRVRRQLVTNALDSGELRRPVLVKEFRELLAGQRSVRRTGASELAVCLIAAGSQSPRHVAGNAWRFVDLATLRPPLEQLPNSPTQRHGGHERSVWNHDVAVPLQQRPLLRQCLKE